MVADHLGKNLYLWGILGLVIPLAPLTFIFSSDHAIRKRLERYKALSEAKLVKPKEYDHLREELLRWYMLRQFGHVPKDDDPAAPPQ